MKILLTMVFAMCLCISSLDAQELPVATEESLTELSEERATKHGRNWLRGVEITTEQWGLIKIERQKLGASMKLARDGMREQLNIILTPEHQEALKAKREERRNNRALRGLWRSNNGNEKGHRRGNRRHNLPEEWKSWDDEAKKAWKDERKAEWKERREARKERKAEEEAAE